MHVVFSLEHPPTVNPLPVLRGTSGISPDLFYSGWLANGKWKARAPVAYKFKDETHFQVAGMKCAYEIFKLSDIELDVQCGPANPQAFLRAVPPSGVNAPFEKPPAK